MRVLRAIGISAIVTVVLFGFAISMARGVIWLGDNFGGWAALIIPAALVFVGIAVTILGEDL